MCLCHGFVHQSSTITHTQSVHNLQMLTSAVLMGRNIYLRISHWFKKNQKWRQEHYVPSWHGLLLTTNPSPWGSYTQDAKTVLLSCRGGEGSLQMVPEEYGGKRKVPSASGHPRRGAADGLWGELRATGSMQFVHFASGFHGGKIISSGFLCQLKGPLQNLLRSWLDCLHDYSL